MTGTDGKDMTQQVRSLLTRWGVVLVVLIVALVWATWRMQTAASRLPATFAAAGASSTEPSPSVEYWTCTMHPKVRSPEPGDCPQCGMELVAKYAGSDELGVPPKSASAVAKSEASAKDWYRCTMPECNDPGSDDPNSRCPVCGMKRGSVDTGPGNEDLAEDEISLSPRARRLAELATEPLERRFLVKRIRTVGKVSYDETRHKVVAAWTGGRIDRLFADFTGMEVAKGDHLVEIYSPQLLTAQEEFLQALQSYAEMEDSALAPARQSARQLVESSRRKLELLGITDQQIDTIERTGQATTHLVIHSPIGGTIVRKPAMEGVYVSTGDLLYEIADLLHVWLMLDLYESDLPWVHAGQEVQVTAESLPGEEFRGRTMFVDPVVNDRTRTIKVRVDVLNPLRRLKPEMYVTAEIEVSLGEHGHPAVPGFGGEFACPMHPWITAEVMSTCSICGMDLIPTESLPGYAPPSEPHAVLSAPAEAVMQTGERALVYLESRPGVYRGVNVQLGPQAEDEVGRQWYPVLAGLSEGDRVVTRGGFVIDSQMQLAGKPSLFEARGLAMGDAETRPSATADAREEISQKLCPVMGLPINPESFIEYKGVKVYFCCDGCDDEFLEHPEQYVSKLPPETQKRIHQAEQSDGGEPLQTLCPVMGHPIDPQCFIEYKGVKVYFCCDGCDDEFVKHPEQYIPKLPAEVQRQIRQVDASQEPGGDG
jgi:Cu(I)/Ag(I) efflux system membrane fusion protein